VQPILAVSAGLDRAWCVPRRHVAQAGFSKNESAVAYHMNDLLSLLQTWTNCCILFTRTLMLLKPTDPRRIARWVIRLNQQRPGVTPRRPRLTRNGTAYADRSCLSVLTQRLWVPSITPRIIR
jgi:hypothetical protein